LICHCLPQHWLQKMPRFGRKIKNLKPWQRS